MNIINLLFIQWSGLAKISVFQCQMVWTIGKHNKKAAILSTIGKQNTIGKTEQTPTIQIQYLFGIPASTVHVFNA